MRKSCGSLSKVHFAHPFLSSVGQREKCLRRNHCCHQKWNYEWNQQFQEHVVPVAPKHIFAIQCLIQAVILCSRHIFPPCDRMVRQSRPQGSRLTQSATMPGCQPDLTWEKPESLFWGSTYLYITSSRKITNSVVLQPVSWKVTSTMGPGVKPEKGGLSTQSDLAPERNLGACFGASPICTKQFANSPQPSICASLQLSPSVHIVPEYRMFGGPPEISYLNRASTWCVPSRDMYLSE